MASENPPPSWRRNLSSFFIDGLSIVSILGIWPRFIEPRLLLTTVLPWRLPPSEAHLEGFRLLHMTDLHFHRKTSRTFLAHLSRRIQKAKPDVIVFTGDFICYSQLDDKKRLQSFLEKLEAPLGSYCVFGNHDYASYVTLTNENIYDIASPPNPLFGIGRAFKKMMRSPAAPTRLAPSVASIPFHQELLDLLKETPFTLLENATVQIPPGLNLTGLGEISLGRFHPEAAFRNYDPRYPGIILSHNPDSFPALWQYPGNFVLSGHTHGEQIHFPLPGLRKISQKLASLDHPQYTRGLAEGGNKLLYVNRGVGCHKPFRFCSPPELLLIQATLKEDAQRKN